jgi:hypothetical protein
VGTKASCVALSDQTASAIAPTITSSMPIAKA